MDYLFYFLFAIILSFLTTRGVIAFARRFNIVDNPASAPERKIQKKSVPFLGGTAIFIAFFLVLTLSLIFSPDLAVGKNISFNEILVIIFSGLVLIIGGGLDDKFNLSPVKQIIFPIMSIIILIIGSVGTREITNPLGGTFQLNFWQWPIFTSVWMMGMMYTTKLLDGLDGLVSGLSVIGSFIIFLLSMATRWYQPDTAFIALIFSGATLGFLFWNFNPARIFLGEGGALFCGFMLGVLSIIAGGKIATALLIMGIPILDVVWVIIRRRFFERKNPFRAADKKHLHFRLLEAGLSQRQAVALYYLFAIIFGSLTLFLQSRDKLLALGILLILMVMVGAAVVYFNGRKAVLDRGKNK